MTSYITQRFLKRQSEGFFPPPPELNDLAYECVKMQDVSLFIRDVVLPNVIGAGNLYDTYLTDESLELLVLCGEAFLSFRNTTRVAALLHRKASWLAVHATHLRCYDLVKWLFDKDRRATGFGPDDPADDALDAAIIEHCRSREADVGMFEWLRDVRETYRGNVKRRNSNGYILVDDAQTAMRYTMRVALIECFRSASSDIAKIIGLPNIYDSSAMEAAAESGVITMVQYAIAAVHVNHMPETHRRKLLGIACSKGDLHMVRWMLDELFFDQKSRAEAASISMQRAVESNDIATIAYVDQFRIDPQRKSMRLDRLNRCGRETFDWIVHHHWARYLSDVNVKAEFYDVLIATADCTGDPRVVERITELLPKNYFPKEATYWLSLDLCRTGASALARRFAAANECHPTVAEEGDKEAKVAELVCARGDLAGAEWLVDWGLQRQRRHMLRGACLAATPAILEYVIAKLYGGLKTAEARAEFLEPYESDTQCFDVLRDRVAGKGAFMVFCDRVKAKGKMFEITCVDRKNERKDVLYQRICLIPHKFTAVDLCCAAGKRAHLSLIANLFDRAADDSIEKSFGSSAYAIANGHLETARWWQDWYQLSCIACADEYRYMISLGFYVAYFNGYAYVRRGLGKSATDDPKTLATYRKWQEIITTWLIGTPSIL